MRRGWIYGLIVHAHVCTDKGLLSYNALRRAQKNSDSWRNAFKSDYCLKFHFKPGKIQPVADVVQINITNKSRVKIRQPFHFSVSGNLRTLALVASVGQGVLSCSCPSTLLLRHIMPLLTSPLIQASYPFNHQIPDHRLVYSNNPWFRVHLSHLETSECVYRSHLTFQSY